MFLADATTKPIVSQDSNTCGADSFMLRDGVCDEASNIAKCLYDGGDCCQENKDKDLCRDCKCMLDVNQEDLRGKFRELEIMPVEDPMSLDTVIVENEGWTVEVEDVVSVDVCSVVCLEHRKADELNAWHYLVNAKICKCGWIESVSCPEKLTADNWKQDYNKNGTLMESHNAFVQLKKTVPCGRLRILRKQ